VFLDDAQGAHYDALASRRISEPKYVDVQLLHTLSLWDALDALFGVLGWSNYVYLRLPVYEKFVYQFFSSFMIDEQQLHNHGPCYIHFRLGDLTHEMFLARFNELL